MYYLSKNILNITIMDYTNMINGTIALLAIAALVVYFKVKGQKTKKNKMMAIQALAKEHGCSLTIFDYWDKTLIGLDQEKGFLFYIRNISGKESRHAVNLSEVSACRMGKTEHRTSYNGNSVAIVDKLEVVLSFSGQKPDLALEFYNTDYDQLTLSGELQMTEKWTSLVKERIAARGPVATKAKEANPPIGEVVRKVAQKKAKGTQAVQ
jgi:hypothetical protein